jgi:hypothetical protein
LTIAESDRDGFQRDLCREEYADSGSPAGLLAAMTQAMVIGDSPSTWQNGIRKARFVVFT